MKCICGKNHWAKNPDGFCDWCGKYVKKMYYDEKELLWACKPCKTLHKPRKIKTNSKSSIDNKNGV